jgi:hypothetical protein
MLNFGDVTSSNRLESTPHSINAYFLEGEGYSLALELPSAEEFEQLKKDRDVSFSIKQIVAEDPFDLQERYKFELKKLLLKRDRFEIHQLILLSWLGFLNWRWIFDQVLVIYLALLK